MSSQLYNSQLFRGQMTYLGFTVETLVEKSKSTERPLTKFELWKIRVGEMRDIETLHSACKHLGLDWAEFLNLKASSEKQDTPQLTTV